MSLQDMKYREAKEILAKQKEAQETINRFKGLETFGKRIGYPSNKELIVDLLEMENEENILGLLSNYKDLLNGDKKVTSKQPSEELTPGKKMIIREELDQGKTISEVAKTYELSEDQVKSALPDD
jgi:hypothetical protein